MSKAKICLSERVCLDDSFMELPDSAKLLYVLLSFECDGYGAITKINMKVRGLGASNDDLQTLIDRGYILKVIDPFTQEPFHLYYHHFVNNKIDAEKNMYSKFKEAIRLMFVCDGQMPYDIREEEAHIVDGFVRRKSGGFQPANNNSNSNSNELEKEKETKGKNNHNGAALEMTCKQCGSIVSGRRTMQFICYRCINCGWGWDVDNSGIVVEEKRWVKD